MLDVAMNIREPEVTTLKLEGKTLVIDAKQVKDGGIEIMDMHRI